MYTHNFSHSTNCNKYLDAYQEVLNENKEAMKPHNVTDEQLIEVLTEASLVNVKSDRFNVIGNAQVNENEVLVKGQGSVKFKLNEIKSAIIDPQSNVLNIKI